jgi:hypothetical protein
MTSPGNFADSDGRCLDQKAPGDLDRRTRLCAACKRPARLTSKSRGDQVDVTIRVEHILTSEALTPSFRARPSA